ncbi:acid protease [Russula earlei]|uniref:Acid protease n=1 Tax=Russula earlei TaxID=71964 RepID=A0ACC0TUH6_9AGAM|nr:acid protease [Russula earlei]
MLPSITLFLSLLLFSSVAAVPPQRRDPLHIPFFRRNVKRSSSDIVDRYAAASQHLREKYGYGSSPPSRRASTTDIGITNQGADTSYFVQMSVGTPGQTLALVLDTGSSDLWFATTGCAGCAPGTPLFNPAGSTTFQTGTASISLTYGSGQAAGVISRDTVTMGPYTVDPQIFVAVDTVSSGLIDGELDGILGLAFEGIANTAAVPFWEALIDNNLLTSPEFSFFLTRFVNDTAATNEEPGGVFTLGGTNSSLFQGTIDFQPFTSPSPAGTFWLQTVSGVLVNGKSVAIGAAGSNSAAIDTGTTLVGAPTAAVNAIWGAVSGATPLSGNLSGFWSYPCSTQLTVSLSFGGPSWPISPGDLNLGTVTNGKCLGAIFDITAGSSIKPQADTPAWIVGDTFLKNVYSVFRANPPAVGFAQLSALSGSSGAPGPVVGTSRATGSQPLSTGGANAAQPTASLGAAGSIATCALVLLMTTTYMLIA